MTNVKEREALERSYKVSETVVLTPGTRFRASGGPYYEQTNADGSVSRIRMRDSGPFTFVGFLTQGTRKNLLAWEADGGFAVLNVGRTYRNPDLPTLVRAPYRNIRRVGVTRRERASARKRSAA
jgi:hypothetical protein